MFGLFKNFNYVSFMKGEGYTPSGHSLQWMWEQSDESLEKNHSYIQYMFPLEKRSLYNPEAPVIRDDEMKALASSLPAVRNIRTSFNVMYIFWESHGKGYGEENHNYLRMTRCMRFLKRIGFDREADRLKLLMDTLNKENNVNKKTLKYWEEAYNEKCLFSEEERKLMERNLEAEKFACMNRTEYER